MSRVVVRSVVLIMLATLFAAKLGLVVAILAIVAYERLSIKVGALWLLSILLVVAAAIATIFQGLPSSPVVGAHFGEDHVIARLAVSVALVLAVYAGMLELGGDLADESVSLRRPGGGVSLRRRRPQSRGAPRQDRVEPDSRPDRSPFAESEG
jgi:hypothetical protein